MMLDILIRAADAIDMLLGEATEGPWMIGPGSLGGISVLGGGLDSDGQPKVEICMIDDSEDRMHFSPAHADAALIVAADPGHWRGLSSLFRLTASNHRENCEQCFEGRTPSNFSESCPYRKAAVDIATPFLDRITLGSITSQLSAPAVS